MVDRMGDRGEPWGVPCEMVLESDTKLLKAKQTRRSVRKEAVYEHTHVGKPRLVMIAMR